MSGETVEVWVVYRPWRSDELVVECYVGVRRPKTIKVDRGGQALDFRATLDVADWERKHASREIAVAYAVKTARRELAHLRDRVEAKAENLAELEALVEASS